MTTRILDKLKGQGAEIGGDEYNDLRIAALLHDIGHYPYSHLLEGVDKVILTEDYPAKFARSRTQPQGAEQEPGVEVQRVMEATLEGGDHSAYPSHEDLGKIILAEKEDLLNILTKERAERIGRYFSGEAITDLQTTKLIHSSLDADRLDYLLRDGHATGVPYGKIDLHFLLNHIHIGADGMIGITMKALPAAEHFLLARAFHTRTVCQHKTVFGFEETARQLLRRLKDRANKHDELESYGVPANGASIEEKVRGNEFDAFADSWVDEIIHKACRDPDPLISALAQCVAHRRPPALLWEYKTFKLLKDANSDQRLFELTAATALIDIIKSHGLDPGYFLVAALKPVGFEKHGAQMNRTEALRANREMAASEMIRVFPSSESEQPIDIVELQHSLLNVIGGHAYHTYRVYLVRPEELKPEKIEVIKSEVQAVFSEKFPN